MKRSYNDLSNSVILPKNMINIAENIQDFLNPCSAQNDPTGQKLGVTNPGILSMRISKNLMSQIFLARSLAIYLVSWGMMRGSSKLLSDYNYRIHIEAVNKLLPYLDELRSYPAQRAEIGDYVKMTWKVIGELKEYYSG